MKMEFESPLFLFALIAMVLVPLVLRYTLVDSPRAQLVVSAVTRGIIVLLIILALAGSMWVSKSDDVAVLVLADLSDSAPEDAEAQVRAFLEELHEESAGTTLTGMVVFAGEAFSTVPLTKNPAMEDAFIDLEEKGETDIEGALLLARETMPASTVNRVVLFSDGNETRGDGIASAKRAASRGIKVYSRAYEMKERDEILLEDLVVPPEVKKGQSFTITAIAQSNLETSATFILYRDGFKIAEREIELHPGANVITFDEPKPGDGLTKYELRVRGADDFFVDNNVASGIVFVSGEPRVLLLEGDEREGRYLARALEAESIRVEVREGKGMPGTLEELAGFDAVILSDVPATELSLQQMTLLRSYIEDLGGGFIMIGGEESFGLGGYYRTAIEDVLPVRMRSEKKKDTPSLAMMLVIDKSGSMAGEKMDLAKEAAIATVELLTDRDYVGVVAFDGEAYWAVELQGAGNKMGLIQTIEMIEAGGGTSIYPALELASEALEQISATFKHAILLTDGHSQPGDFNGVVEYLADNLVTVSAVAVGEGADTELLQDIARWGKGRYYFTTDPYDIPQIFTKETMTASKSSLIEEPFLAQVFHPHQVIQSIDWETAPFLFGYVVTTPKATAEVLLASERGDPLLVMWRYGLGKTVAFTSDAKTRWASDWVGWSGYGKFWAQVVRDAMRTSQSRGAETHITYKGARGRIFVDNVDSNGNFVNGLITSAQIIGPNLQTAPLELPQIAPGRYEGVLDMAETGSYLFKIRQAIPSSKAGEAPETIADYTRGFTISYKPEYRHLTTNEAYLKEMAEVTGGSYGPSAADVLRVEASESVSVRNRLWPWLLGAALLLFLLDVALRRMDLAGWGAFGTARRYG